MRLIRLEGYEEKGPRPEAKRFAKNEMNTKDYCLLAVKNLSWPEMRSFKDEFFEFYKTRRGQEVVKAIGQLKVGSTVTYMGPFAERRHHHGVFITNGDTGVVLKKNRTTCKVEFKNDRMNIWRISFALLKWD